MTSAVAFTPQPTRSAPNMALRVERSVGEGLRRLCRTAVLATIGAVQSLFASPEAVVAEPAKRGLFALFGR